MAGIDFSSIMKGAGGVMKTVYSITLYLLILAIVGAVIFIIIKLRQYKYSATILAEKEGNIIDIEYTKCRRVKHKGGGFEWQLWKDRTKLPSQLAKEFRGNKILLFRDREGNYREPKVILPDLIKIKGSDRIFAAHEIEDAYRAYENKSKWEKLMPIVAWGSVLVLNIIAWIIIGNILQKVACGG